ncbi:hypothetical protein PR202_ga15378 [Eleusine coracana subsp. coracana]|uniref:Uncharacterized protein n=1 Tax=Eleusine coracana subsp. coracana TaxID=191504 RepID=A0AAV5CK11_ELECO|nr:hypothetical protein PR202_ga15378 [Eleusine coracana subsp. coracana]
MRQPGGGAAGYLDRWCGARRGPAAVHLAGEEEDNGMHGQGRQAATETVVIDGDEEADREASSSDCRGDGDNRAGPPEEKAKFAATSSAFSAPHLLCRLGALHSMQSTCNGGGRRRRSVGRHRLCSAREKARRFVRPWPSRLMCWCLVDRRSSPWPLNYRLEEKTHPRPIAAVAKSKAVTGPDIAVRAWLILSTNNTWIARSGTFVAMESKRAKGTGPPLLPGWLSFLVVGVYLLCSRAHRNARDGKPRTGVDAVQWPRKGAHPFGVWPWDPLSGLSSFYAGKSKSFTSLAEATSTVAEAKGLAKPENPFNKRRRILANWSRRASCSSLATVTYLPPLLAPDHAVAEGNEGEEDDSDDDYEDNHLPHRGKNGSNAPGLPLPPSRLGAHAQVGLARINGHGSFRSPRSFSLSDLQNSRDNNSS